MMYMLMDLREVGSMPNLDNTKGSNGQIARDSVTGNLYVKRAAGWTEIQAGGAMPTEVGLSLTVQTQGGGVQRTLTEVGGVVTLAGTDTILSNNGAVVLKNHAGTVSSGVSGLNSAGTVANVASGALTAVTAGA